MAAILPFPSGPAVGAQWADEVALGHAAEQGLVEVRVAITMVRDGLAPRVQLVNVAATPVSLAVARGIALAEGVELEVREDARRLGNASFTVGPRR